ncbi:MAG: hypothetical protein OXK76_18855 [Gammaproteobacteria bacterium]|nr:hypothetical protein [Gammaproteobacteria bacterium]
MVEPGQQRGLAIASGSHQHDVGGNGPALPQHVETVQQRSLFVLPAGEVGRYLAGSRHEQLARPVVHRGSVADGVVRLNARRAGHGASRLLATAVAGIE